MAYSDQINAVGAIILWRNQYPLRLTVASNPSGTITVFGCPCGCNDVMVDVDWPVDQWFLKNLRAALDRELARAKANCICNRQPFVLDFAGMGCDSPTLAKPFRLLCSHCDHFGPDDLSDARSQGWSDIVLADELGDPNVSHLGSCPSCVKARHTDAA